MKLVLTGFDRYSSHLPVLPLAMWIALAPFAAGSPATSEDLNGPLICDHKLTNRNVLMSPVSCWLTTLPSIMDGLPQATFPSVWIVSLWLSPWNSPGLPRHKNLLLTYIIGDEVMLWEVLSILIWLIWVLCLAGLGSRQSGEDGKLPVSEWEQLPATLPPCLVFNQFSLEGAQARSNPLNHQCSPHNGVSQTASLWMDAFSSWVL